MCSNVMLLFRTGLLLFHNMIYPGAFLSGFHAMPVIVIKES